MDCARCGDELPPGPAWQTYCRDCFKIRMREDREAAEQALLKRALEAEAKVQVAKRVVLQLQGELRKKEGELRAAQGKIGLQANAPGRNVAGLDLDTLKKLRRLVHPDRHGNSPMSVEVAQIINVMIQEAER